MMRKSQHVGCCLSALAISVLLIDPALADPSKYTANSLRGNSNAELGKKVSVDVSWVQALRRAQTDDFAVFGVHTWDERENLPGGIIPAVVPKALEAEMARKYGTSPDIEKRRGRGGVDLDTGRLSGVLSETGGKVLYLDLTDGAAAKSGLKLSTDAAPGASIRERIKGQLRAKG